MASEWLEHAGRYSAPQGDLAGQPARANWRGENVKQDEELFRPTPSIYGMWTAGGAALLSASLVANVAGLETDLRERLQATLSDAYRLERELGGGGMSRVFLAEELALGRRVVVKVLSPDLAAGVNFERFKREILVTARLQHPHTEIVALEGNGHLERVAWRSGQNGSIETQNIRHVFTMTGAEPSTKWLRGCLALDDKGFVKTGPVLTPDDLVQWALRRQPYLVETSLPGVLAVGDVRSGSTKRVASAVGEGSIAVATVHQVLAE